MIYTADVHGHESIKLARGASMGNWKSTDNLLYLPGPGGRDSGKETAFYRKSLTGKHQIFYIGYPDDDDSYQAEIYLAEAGDLAGPYTQYADPVYFSRYHSES